MDDKPKRKSEMCLPQPTEHVDPRMHLTLGDMQAPFRDEPKLVYPLRRSKG